MCFGVRCAGRDVLRLLNVTLECCLLKRFLSLLRSGLSMAAMEKALTSLFCSLTLSLFFTVSRIVLSRAIFWPYLHLSLGILCSEVCPCMLAFCMFHMALVVPVPVLFPQSRHQQCFSLPGLMD